MKGFMFEGKKILYCDTLGRYASIDSERADKPGCWVEQMYYAPGRYIEVIFRSLEARLAFTIEHDSDIFMRYSDFLDYMRRQEEVDNDELTQLQVDYNELAKKHQLLVESNAKLMKKHDKLAFDYREVTLSYKILIGSNTLLWKNHDSLIDKHRTLVKGIDAMLSYEDRKYRV